MVIAAMSAGHHAAMSIGEWVQGVQAGQSVIFASASHVLLDLAGQESARALDRRLRHYANVNLLVLDELGYLAHRLPERHVGDRLIHHAVIPTIDGTSFRRREAEAEAVANRPPATKAAPPAGRPKSRGRGVSMNNGEACA